MEKFERTVSWQGVNSVEAIILVIGSDAVRNVLAISATQEWNLRALGPKQAL